MKPSIGGGSILAVILLFVAAPSPADLTPAGRVEGDPLPPIPVALDTTTYALAVAADAQGDFVVVWESDSEDGDGYGIFAKYFNADGTVRVEKLQVNEYWVGDQVNPSVAMDAGGDFVVAWQSAGQDGSGLGIFARRFAASGQPIGGEFQVNAVTSGDQSNPRVAMDVAGNFLAVWQGQGIYGQRFNPIGEPLGGEFRIDSGHSSGVAYPDVAADPLGAVVVVWQHPELSPSRSVRGRRLTALGEPDGGEFTVGTGFQALFPRVDRTANGTFVVAWKSADSTIARLYRADGTANGEAFLVHRADPFSQPQVVLPANIAMDWRGDFAIAWDGYSAGNGFRSYCQRFSREGSVSGSTFIPSPVGTFPDVSVSANGSLVVVCRSGSTIYAHRLPSAEDWVGPIVTGVGHRGLPMRPGQYLTQSPSECIVWFSEDLAREGTAAITDPSHWGIRRNGVEIPGGIVAVTFWFNPVSAKYEATIAFDGGGPLEGVTPLSDGHYTLTIRDSVTDVAGNALDGDLDGTPGGAYTFAFGVADPLAQWHWRNPLPNGLNLYGITYANGRYVAVGDEGTILTSSDGREWISRPLGFINDYLNSVTYGAGKFVAVGSHRPDSGRWRNTLLTSSDALDWTAQETGTTNLLTSITYGNGIFLACGHQGLVLTSPDAMTWTPANIGGANYTYFTASATHDVFLLGGYYRTNDISGPFLVGTIWSSFDAVQWLERDSWIPFAPEGIAYGAGTFLAVGVNNDYQIALTSQDGVSWNEVPSNIHSNIRDAAFGNGRFVAVGVGNGGVVGSSTDALNWQTRRLDFSYQSFNEVIYGDAEFVAVGGYVIGAIAHSTDGENWTVAGSICAADLLDVTFGADTFVAVGATGAILTSADGARWARQTTDSIATLTAATFHDGWFVVVGHNGTIFTSTDGTQWFAQDSGTSERLLGVVYGENGYCAVGNSGSALLSEDAVDWSVVSSGSNRRLRGVTYGDGKYVAVGSSISPVRSLILVSSNGVNWSSTTLAWDYQLVSVAYGNGLFVAVDSNGRIIVSTDATDWLVKYSDASRPPSAIEFLDHEFVAIGWTGLVLTSADGETWTLRETGSLGRLNGIANGVGSFVAVGELGVILQSNPVLEAPPVVFGDPRVETVPWGGLLSLRADGYGTPPPSYQWYRDGVLLVEETNPVLDVDGVRTSDTGVYSVVAINSLGAFTSQVATVTISAGGPSAAVAGRWALYNGSSFDANNAGANASDDGAIAVDKIALREGQNASFANYTSYSKGMNGIIIDIEGLHEEVSASDFEFKIGNDNNPSTWADASIPAISVRPGAGAGGSDRITLIWPDRAIANTWLQVTVLPTARTGLQEPDVFYLGNAIGDTGDNPANAQVNVLDEGAIRVHPRNFLNPAPIDSPWDINRDKNVNVQDEAIARANATSFLTALKLITVPVSSSDGVTERASTRPRR